MLSALMKDMMGEICGEKFAGVHATSVDGLNWDFDRATLAYRRTVRWSDGRTTQQGFLERPRLFIENGIPTHLFGATAECPGVDLKDATDVEHRPIPPLRPLREESSADSAREWSWALWARNDLLQAEVIRY